MKANELMTGDYVRYKRTKEIIWVFEIDSDRDVINNEPDGYCNEKNIEINNIEPIPLTLEILEKNGFRLHNSASYFKEYMWTTGDLEDYFEGYEDALVLLKEQVLDTLEVKDVDLEEEYKMFVNCDEGRSMFETARHFFELGLKARKGE